MRRLSLATLLLALLGPLLLQPIAVASAAPSLEQATPSRGRPTVKLNRLTLPPISDADAMERYLRQVLRSEVRRADWGAGRGNTIEYRFKVEELSLTNESGVLHVTCSASGRMPRGQAARSHLVFGGNPNERDKLVKHVLGIVARGVITRLAQMERVRRGGK